MNEQQGARLPGSPLPRLPPSAKASALPVRSPGAVHGAQDRGVGPPQRPPRREGPGAGKRAGKRSVIPNPALLARTPSGIAPPPPVRVKGQTLASKSKPSANEKRLSYYAALRPPSLIVGKGLRRTGARVIPCAFPGSPLIRNLPQVPDRPVKGSSALTPVPGLSELAQEHPLVEYVIRVGLGPGLETEYAHNDPKFARYKGQIIDRFPRNNKPDAPVPPHVWMFCFPGGISLSAEPVHELEHFIFTLTEIDGARFYGACLQYYCPVPEATLRTLLGADGDIPQLYAPECLCVLSHQSYFAAFNDCLAEVHLSLHKPDGHVPVELLLAQLQTMPLPAPGVEIFAAFGSRQLSLKSAPSGQLELLHFSYSDVFNALGVANIVLLFSHVLHERKICMFSQHKNLLTTTAELLTSLLTPFSWPHVFIPVLPRKLLDILMAPTPFIIGIHTSYLIEATAEADDVILVDLDNGKVHSPHEDLMPKGLTAKLVDGVGSVMPMSGDMEVQERIRRVFLDFFVLVMADYGNSFSYVRRFPSPIAIFNKAAFLRSRRSKELAEFSNAFVETQLFFVFLDDYSRPIGFFDELVAAESLSQAAAACQVMEKVVRDGRRGHVKASPAIQLPDISSITQEVHQRVGGQSSVSLPSCDSPALLWACSQLSVRYDEVYEQIKAEATCQKSRQKTWNDYLCGLELQNLQRLKVSRKSVAAVVTKDAAATEFIQSRVDDILAAKPITGSNLALLLELFQLDDGRLLFPEILTTTRNERAEGGLVSAAGFDLLCELVMAMLTACLNYADFEAAAKLMNVSGVFYHQVGGSVVHLFEGLREHAVWRNRHYWEALFFDSIALQRSELGAQFISMEMDFSALSEAAQKEIIDTEESLIFGVLSKLASSMLKFSLSAHTVHMFVRRLCNLAQMPDEMADNLEKLVANLAQAIALSSDGLKVHDLGEEEMGNIKELYQRLVEVERVSQHRARRGVKQQLLKKSWRTSAALKGVTQQLDSQFGSKPELEPAAVSQKLPTSVTVDKQGAYSVKTLRGHLSDVHVLELDGSIAASGSSNGIIMVWDTSSGNCHRQLLAHADKVTCICFDEDNLASGGQDKRVVVFDTQRGEKKAVLQEHLGSVSALQLCENLIISGSFDNTIKVWDCRNARGAVATLEGHSGAVSSLAYNGAGLLVSGSRDTSVRVWDLRKAAVLSTFSEHKDWISHVKLSRSILPGKLLSSSFDGTIKLWDLESLSCDRTFADQGGAVNCFDFSSDTLVSGSRDGGVRRWDLASGSMLDSYVGHSNEVSDVVMMPDGKVASASYDSSVRVWTAGSSEAEVLSGHEDWVTRLCRRREMLVSASIDSTLRVWAPSVEVVAEKKKKTFMRSHKKRK